ncbi:DUF427 domain-containing protein [Nocardioides sp.]|uniref:DUF427 domain-containing protein n=1 Tax=Nocardioides sp. TaxID=35761 RepID=UPI002ED104E5
MAVDLSRASMQLLPELRFQRVHKRLTVRLGDQVVALTDRAVLVMEPMRVVPSYAVPVADLLVPLEPGPANLPPEYRPVGFGEGGPPLLDPSVPFGVHSAEGQPVRLRAGGEAGDGFRFSDPDLADLVCLDFDQFDWWEEDEPIMGHPRDPFHRIDVRRSSRRVQISHEGTLLAASSRPHLLFEAAFPLPRYYLPLEDVSVELRPAALSTTCAYKGHATHYDAVLDDRGAVLEAVAWSYEEPLDDARDVRGMVSFYQERLDLELDGAAVPRVRTPWSD